MKCCVLMHCSLPHNPCCSLLSPMSMLHLLIICTYLNVFSSIACPHHLCCVDVYSTTVYLIQDLCPSDIVFISLLQFFFKENVMNPVWICRDLIFSDFRDLMIIFSNCRDPNRVPKRLQKNMLCYVFCACHSLGKLVTWWIFLSELTRDTPVLTQFE